MTQIQKIKKEVEGLSREELDAFRRWFMEYDGAAWDRQIESDIRAGKLDRMANDALADHRAGRSREL